MPWARRAVAALVLTALLPTPAAASAAAPALTALSAAPDQDRVRDRQDAVRRDQEQTEARLDETTEQVADLSVRLEQARTAVADNEAALASARQEVRAARDEESVVAGRLAVAEEVERNAVEAVALAQDEHRSALVEVGRSARTAYVGAQTSTTLDVLFGSSTLDDFAARSDMLDRLGRLQTEVVTQAQLKGAVSESARARRTAASDAVQQAREAAQANVERAAAAESAQATLTQDAEALAAAEQALLVEASQRRDQEMTRLDGLEQEAVALEAEMQRLAREAAERAAREQAAREKAEREAAERAAREQAAREQAAREASREQAARDEAARRASRSVARPPAPPPAAAPAPAPAPPPAASSSSDLLRPTPGRVTSSFGWRIHPIYGTRRLHRGTDFGDPCGTPVRAPASGRVSSAGAAGSAGNRIILDHGVVDGTSLGTVYMHLQGFAVRSGERVDRGEVIGYVGTTGSSTGCHLHFELYRNGTAVDPMRYL